MKRIAFLLIYMMTLCLPLCAQGYTLPKGKEIYIPKELRDNDFTSRDSKWSYYRMACTPNVVCFWEKGFGDDLSKAPDLDGHKMTVDLDNLLSRVEYFYNVYRDMMGFLLPGSKAEKYRMMVMLNYSLEGTAYGGSYDDEIGALWIAPNRVQDKTLNCIAHEIGHSFQIQISCDGQSQGMGGGIFETSAQWMLWNVNPRWTTDENYHWDAFKKLIHLSLFNSENMYHAPFVLEYWSYLHGLTYMADMFREMKSEMQDAGNGWQKPVNAPQTYGFNVDEITLPAVGKTVKVQFQALSTADNIGYRYGLVAVDNDNNPTYLGANSEVKKTLTYKNPGNIKRLYLVVVGCPSKEYRPESFGFGRRRGQQQAETAQEGPATYPYQIKVIG